MMKRLQLLSLCKKAKAGNLKRGISTDIVLLARARRPKVPPVIPYEPGIRRRQEVFRMDADVTEDVEDEDDIDNEINMMNIDEAYDASEREHKKSRQRIQQLITQKKFFSPPPQPLMLTCNERQCIKYLHKEDPVQWNLQTLSEAFPATPDTIKKIIKSKRKITPETAKLLDTKAQRNWELLAEGKLDAAPHVLEHMKKFINRREVLLEQIKNVNFYLPEVKKEPVWNKGEFAGLLAKYEKAVKKLANKSDKTKMLQDGVSEVKNETEEEKSSLDVVHQKINETVKRKRIEDKDSFLFGNLAKFYSKPTTLEYLEDQILKQADNNKKLDVLDKAILENKLGINNKKSSENLTESELYVLEQMKRRSQGRNFEETHMRRESTRNPRKVKIEENEEVNETSFPDSRTKFTTETGVMELLSNLNKKTEPEEPREPKTKAKNTEGKPKIDFSDPERVRRENVYYDAEVKDIEETSFWNSLKTSQEKALVEFEKRPLYIPDDAEPGFSVGKTSVLSSTPYPERIKIPKNKQGSGLTFKVKDCYYDDDGEFLYRVPGMIK